MTKRLLIFTLAITLSIGGLLGRAVASPSAQAEPATCNRIYIFLGLTQVFSTGMYKLAHRLSRAGYTVSVHSWTIGGVIADRIRREYPRKHCKIVLIGHSSGAATAVDVANMIENDNIPVALLISYDMAFRKKVGRNVQRTINYYVPILGAPILGKPIGREAGFDGDVENDNLSGDAGINHFSIDSSDRVHDMAIRAIQKALGQ